MAINHYWSIHTAYSVLWRNKIYIRSRIDLRKNTSFTADDVDDIVDIIAMMMFTGYAIYSQCMLGNLAQHCKSRSLSANQIGIK